MTFKVGSYYTVIGDTGYSELKPGAVIKIKKENYSGSLYEFHSFDWGAFRNYYSLLSDDRSALKPATRKQIARYKKERSLRS